MDFQEKLQRPRGLSTNLINSDAENAAIIRFIMEAYLNGTTLHRAARTEDVWELVMDLPTNFESYRYRVAQ